MSPTIGSQIGVRWWVARTYLRPVRFGERAADALVWAVTPVTGKGKDRTPVGQSSYYARRSQALDFAHREARRTYGRTQP